ncbi:MAG TPA: hypothetical protein VL984_09240 [Acidimicrobiales bacterium]|nr:hypothetical protein [Acidimicrobiales bacterium]
MPDPVHLYAQEVEDAATGPGGPASLRGLEILLGAELAVVIITPARTGRKERAVTAGRFPYRGTGRSVA